MNSWSPRSLMTDGSFALAVEPYGSRIVCNPAPTDTDEDWIVLAQNPYVDQTLIKLGFRRSDREYSHEAHGHPIHAYRGNGNLNIVVTTDREFFRRTMEATRLARRFNLLDKSDRVALHEVVVDQIHTYILPDEKLVL